MLKDALLYLSNQQPVYRLVMRLELLRSLATRFVAGEEQRDAVVVAEALNSQGLGVSLDHLGEHVETLEESDAAAAAYLSVLDAIEEARLDAYVSLKLTQMGLDLSRERCLANVRRILDRAMERGGTFVRFDMESAAYTDRTLETHEALWREGYRNVGVVLQAYLYRTAADLERVIQLGARVRLCKGAYLEPPEVAWPKKSDVDASYARLSERLLLAGDYPAFATHDERLIRRVQDLAHRHGIGPERFEFQMLFGVRRDLQLQLQEQGYRVRVYVPYGRQWYPYLMRRLAERPANLVFFARSVLDEALASRRNGGRRRGA